MTDNDIGGRLRMAREQRGVSLGDLARLTKLSTTTLQAIERNDFASLPAGMYRKAYLRTVAAEFGLDPNEIAADYDALHEPPVAPAIASNVAVTVPDRWVEELMPSPRRTIATLTALAMVSAAWFVFQPDSVPARAGLDTIRAESESLVMRTAVDAQRTAAAPDVQGAGTHVATAPEPSDSPLKIELATTGWCWVAAESDGERVLYGLIEPGKRLVVEGQSRISVRLGDAGSVRLSINDGPRRTPGAEGEVVDLEVTSDGVKALGDGAVNPQSVMVGRSDFSS